MNFGDPGLVGLGTACIGRKPESFSKLEACAENRRRGGSNVHRDRHVLGPVEAVHVEVLTDISVTMTHTC